MILYKADIRPRNESWRHFALQKILLSVSLTSNTDTYMLLYPNDKVDHVDERSCDSHMIVAAGNRDASEGMHQSSDFDLVPS